MHSNLQCNTSLGNCCELYLNEFFRIRTKTYSVIKASIVCGFLLIKLIALKVLFILLLEFHLKKIRMLKSANAYVHILLNTRI